jgi:hypothetical protein
MNSQGMFIHFPSSELGFFLFFRRDTDNLILLLQKGKKKPPKSAKAFLKKNPVTELRIDTFLFFFLKCPSLFIKLHSSHDEIRRGSTHPL